MNDTKLTRFSRASSIMGISGCRKCTHFPFSYGLDLGPPMSSASACNGELHPSPHPVFNLKKMSRFKYFMGIFSYTCVSVHCLCTWYPQRPGGDIRSPKTTVTGSREPPCGCWRPSSDPCKGSQLLTTEPSLQTF